MIGTERYMAPEQLADGKITPAAEVYACGVVADELLPQSRPPSSARSSSAACGRTRATDSPMPDPSATPSTTVDGDGEVGVVPPDPVADSADAPPAGDTARPRPTGPPRRTVARRRRSVRTRVAAVAAVLAIVAAGVLIATNSGGGSDSPTTADVAKQRPPAPSARYPTSSDPAEQARQLADFFRAQSR